MRRYGGYRLFQAEHCSTSEAGMAFFESLICKNCCGETNELHLLLDLGYLAGLFTWEQLSEVYWPAFVVFIM